MKTTNQIRSMATVMVLLFVVTATGCQKENEITPNPGTGVTPPPVVSPPAPAVVPKPREITTITDGVVSRIQTYTYDSQEKLSIYVSKNETSVDSVIMQSDQQVSFRTVRNNGSKQNVVLSLNANKTYKRMDLLSPVTGGVADQAVINNTQFRIDSIMQPRTGLPLGKFNYISNNLNAIQTEVQRINVNYFNNLPYQKGINEILLPSTPLKYYKLLEQEDITTTHFFDKLMQQVIINIGSGRFELHDYSYEFDNENRVTKITDAITFTTSGSSVRKIAVSTITY